VVAWTTVRVPALAVIVTATPGITADFASFATTVMLAVAEPSDGIVVKSDATEREFRVPPTTPPPPELPVPPTKESPPHAASSNVNTDNAAIEKNLRMIHPDL
jgi:hypothetical protein